MTITDRCFLINLAVRNNDIYTSKSSTYLVVNNWYPIKLWSSCRLCQLLFVTSGKTATMLSSLWPSRSSLGKWRMMKPAHASVHQRWCPQVSAAIAPGRGGTRTHGRHCCLSSKPPQLPAQAWTMITMSSSSQLSRLLSQRWKMVEPAHEGICQHQCPRVSVAIAPGDGGVGAHCCQCSRARTTRRMP